MFNLFDDTTVEKVSRSSGFLNAVTPNAMIVYDSHTWVLIMPY
ncbi:MAG: hypothetical protein ACJAVZ_003555 [Afipia broomeae]|jgi:hypothetical protein